MIRCEAIKMDGEQCTRAHVAKRVDGKHLCTQHFKSKASVTSVKEREPWLKLGLPAPDERNGKRYVQRIRRLLLPPTTKVGSVAAAKGGGDTWGEVQRSAENGRSTPPGPAPKAPLAGRGENGRSVPPAAPKGAFGEPRGARGAQSGYIYIYFLPREKSLHYWKIGRTQRSVEARMKEWSTKYALEVHTTYKAERDVVLAESLIHLYLTYCRMYRYPSTRGYQSVYKLRPSDVIQDGQQCDAESGERVVAKNKEIEWFCEDVDVVRRVVEAIVGVC